jgi:hypothetical protein
VKSCVLSQKILSTSRNIFYTFKAHKNKYLLIPLAPENEFFVFSVTSKGYDSEKEPKLVSVLFLH